MLTYLVDAGELSAGPHTIPIPVETFADVEEDYYLVAVADVDDDEPENDSEAFSGGVFVTNDGVVHFQAALAYATDTVVAQVSGGDYQLLWNGAVEYSTDDLQEFQSVHVRTHSGNDSVTIDTPSSISGWVFGGAGSDNIYGGGGADRLYGASGYDTIYGYEGQDHIDGGDGGYGYGYGSYLLGGDDDDEIHGTGDSDYIGGGDGDDLLYGGDEPNGYGGYYSGGYGDIMLGGAGEDVLFGGDGDDSLSGGDDGDILYGESGDDDLAGQGENDILIGGTGSNTLDWGQGTDWLHDDILVTTDSDEDEPLGDPDFRISDLSLREALTVAAEQPDAVSPWSGAHPDIIGFAFASPGEIVLDGELSVGSFVEIVGPGQDLLTLSGDKQTRLFSVTSAGDVTMRDFTIADGHLGTSEYGGGIISFGDLTLERMTFENNYAGERGGAVFGGGSHRTVTITDSTFVGNESKHGGAVYLHAEDPHRLAYITGSTFVENHANAKGGGLHVRGDSSDSDDGEVVVANSTFWNNSAGYYGGAISAEDHEGLKVVNSTIYENSAGDEYAGGIRIKGGQAIVHNSIVAHNTAPSSPDIYAYGGATLDDQNNHVTVDGDPMLSPLGKYGGPTLTFYLKPTSPAIDAGLDANLPIDVTTDQRGEARIYDDPSEVNVNGLATQVDIGAVEYFGQFIWREAERFDDLEVPPSGPKLEVIGDRTASDDRSLGMFEGGDSGSGGSPTTNIATYNISVAKAGDFRLWVRVVAPDGNSDSLWFRFNDDAEWTKYSIPHGTQWRWRDARDSSGAVVDTPLQAGVNVLQIATREDGVQLDKLLLTDNVDPYTLSGASTTYKGGTDVNSPFVDLPATVRDFHSSTWAPQPTSDTEPHPDFDAYFGGAETPELVLEQSDFGNPAFNPAPPALPYGPQLTGESALDQWFYDVTSVNRSADVSMRLREDPTRDGVYQFVGSTGAAGGYATTHEFFPIDGALFASDSGSLEYEAPVSDNDGSDRESDEITESHNYGFTLEVRAEFTYEAGQRIAVPKGNDDLWIYIDGRLFLDLGGVHAPVGHTSKYLDGFGLVEGKKYSFNLFYANRSTDDAHLVFETTIDTLTPARRLVEGQDFVTEHRVPLDIPANAEAITLRYWDLGFDNPADDSAVNDAFEIAIVDADGASVLPSVSSGSGAFFNWTEGQQDPFLAPGVTHDPTEGTVTLDISSLPATDPLDSADDVQIVFRLVNNDLDTASTVTVSPSVADTPLPGGAGDPTGPPIDYARAAAPIDVAALDDVTGRFDVSYTHTMYDEETQTLRSGVSLTANSLDVVRGPLILVVKDVRQRFAGGSLGTTLARPDGHTPDGFPYYDISPQSFSVGDQLIEQGEAISGRELLFNVPSEEQFDYDIQILGQLNDAPAFTNDPLLTDSVNRVARVRQGNTLTYDAEGADPNDDDVHFSFFLQPTGLGFVNPTGEGVSLDGKIEFDTTGLPLGRYEVRMSVTDKFGLSDPANDKTFAVEVHNGPNRAPYFIPPAPVTEAYVGIEYSFDSEAFDLDYDKPLHFSISEDETKTSEELLNDPTFTINEDTGEVTWTPTSDQVGETYQVELLVDDGELSGNLPYSIEVFAAPGNRDPYFTSDPDTDFVVPLAPPTSMDDVSPTSIVTTLAPGQEFEQDVYTVVPDGTDVVELVIVLDQSDSMTKEFEWLQESGFLQAIGDALLNEGLSEVRFGLTVFGESDYVVKVPVGREEIAPGVWGDAVYDFGTVEDLQLAVSGLEVAVLDAEDGYHAIDAVIEGYTRQGATNPAPYEFTANAAKGLLLITDEPRNVFHYGGDADSIQSTIAGFGASLNVIVDTPFGIIPGGSPATSLFHGKAGIWSVDAGEYVVTPEESPQGPGDTYSSFALLPLPVPYSEYLIFPDYEFEFQIADAGPGFQQNAYLIFDYSGEDDFKFAGVSADDDTIQIGHKTASDWVVDEPYDFDGNVDIQAGVTYTLVLQRRVRATYSVSSY